MGHTILFCIDTFASFCWKILVSRGSMCYHSKYKGILINFDIFDIGILFSIKLGYWLSTVMALTTILLFDTEYPYLWFFQLLHGVLSVPYSWPTFLITSLGYTNIYLMVMDITEQNIRDMVWCNPCFYIIQSMLYIVVQRLNIKEPKRIHLEPVVCISDYYLSNIGEVPQSYFLRWSTT